MQAFLTIIGGVVVSILGIALYAVLLLWPLWWGWNTFAHDLLGLPAIQYWFQALALSFILGGAKGSPTTKSS